MSGYGLVLCVDYHDEALGCVRMPPGYHLVRVDDHWMWVHPETDRESCIHWDRWAIYRGAVEDARKRADMTHCPTCGVEITPSNAGGYRTYCEGCLGSIQYER